MKLLLNIAVLLVVFQSPARSQNLVPNGSFEEYSDCPASQGDIAKAAPWNGFPATSDFFHRCGSGEVGVPENGPGNQDAYSGSGYAGIIVNWNAQPYDYLYVPLNETLRAGESYCVSLWVSCADQPRLATDDLCVCFTSEIPTVEALETASYAVRNPVGNVLDDTQNWVQLSNNIRARGDERFIVIGSCRSDSTNYAPLNASSFFDPDTYYYIDEVSVIPENFELEIEVGDSPTEVYCSDDSVVLRTNLGAVGNSVWNDGTNASSTTATASGIYSVTTQVGCSVYEAQLEINFEDCSCDLAISNVSTPNDDGKNDVF